MLGLGDALIVCPQMRGGQRLIAVLRDQDLVLVGRGGSVHAGCGLACGLPQGECRCGGLRGRWLRGYGWRRGCCQRLQLFLGSWGGRLGCSCLGVGRS